MSPLRVREKGTTVEPTGSPLKRKPYTLNPKPYTLHPKLLNPTPYTLNPKSPNPTGRVSPGLQRRSPRSSPRPKARELSASAEFMGLGLLGFMALSYIGVWNLGFRA